MPIAVIGSNMVDLISYIERMPAEGETVEAPDFQMGCGGKGANQAVAAARLGAEVVMLTRVGSDLFADNTIANFTENGIDTTFVLRTEGPSGVAPIFVDKDSHNSIIIIKGANKHLTPADIEKAAPRLKECDLLVLQLEIPLQTVYAAVRFGAENGIPVLVNPAPADPQLELQQIKTCKFFVPNETELALLTSLPVTTDEEVRAAADKLAQAGIENVIVTLGSRGVLWVNREQTRFFPACEVEARDTTGAGDAFIGCFARTWVGSGDIARSIEVANHYAADSVTKLGTQTSYAKLEQFQCSYPHLEV